MFPKLFYLYDAKHFKKKRSMPKQPSHRIWLGMKGVFKPNQNCKVYIFHRFGAGKITKTTTPVSVPYNAWDKKNKCIKNNLLITYSKESEYIDDLKSKITETIIDLTKGTLTLENAFRKLKDKSDDGSIETWIENSGRLTDETKNKYRRYLNGFYKHLPKEFNPLMLSHIQDADSIDYIAKTINNNLGNGAIDYLKMLDAISDYAGQKQKRPFKVGKYYKGQIAPDNLPLTYTDVLNGFDAMRTKQDFMSMNFWLLSLSLRGLSGIDICNIAKENIVTDDGNYDGFGAYYPDWYLEPEEWSGMGQKVYFRKRRGKREKNKPMTILLNLFPSWLLHQSLQDVIKSTHPQYAYKGDDDLRIFNFLTKNKDNTDNAEGKAKWKSLKSTIYKKLKRMLDAGLHRTRMSFLNNENIKLTEAEEQELLGHKSKKAIQHYRSSHQIKTDLHHVKLIEDFSLMKLIIYFYEIAYQKGLIGFKLTYGAVDMLIKNKLTTFSIDDQLRLEVLKMKHSEEPEVDIVNGKVVYIEGEKSKELIDLEKKQEEVYRTPQTIYLKYKQGADYEDGDHYGFTNSKETNKAG
jgi:hypothetical protein